MFNKYIKMICQNVSYYICILIVFAIVSFLYDPIIAIIEFIVISVISILYINNISKNKKNLEKFLESECYLDDVIYKDPLSKFPMPAAIIEANGKIIDSATFYVTGDVDGNGIMDKNDLDAVTSVIMRRDGKR